MAKTIKSDSYYDPKELQKMSFMGIISRHWKGRKDFLKAQAQVAVILVIATIGNNWPTSYHRNENHKPFMFWIMNAVLLVASILTLKHDANGSQRGVQLLSRPQTEEWKGWMQWAFIMVRKKSLKYKINERRRETNSALINAAYSITTTVSMMSIMPFASLFR